MRIIIWLVVAMALSACNRCKTYGSADEMVAHASKSVHFLSPDDLNKLMGSDEVYTLIDVRQEIEHYYGYIPGSVILPRGSLEFNIGDETFWEHEGLYMPKKDEKIVVYCKKGNRAIMAADALQKLGYSNVFALEGGWKAWEVAYPDVYEKSLDKLGGGSSTPKSGGC